MHKKTRGGGKLVVAMANELSPYITSNSLHVLQVYLRKKSQSASPSAPLASPATRQGTLPPAGRGRGRGRGGKGKDH